MVDGDQARVVLVLSPFKNGWCDLALKIADERFVFRSISYTTDVLGDLLRFALALAVGCAATECSFDQETTELRLRGVSDTVNADIRVYKFASIFNNQPVEQGERVFLARCTVDAFARASISVAETMLNSLGEAGYKSEWRVDFPHRPLVALKAVLASP
jgi:hypothetical protein